MITKQDLETIQSEKLAFEYLQTGIDIAQRFFSVLQESITQAGVLAEKELNPVLSGVSADAVQELRVIYMKLLALDADLKANHKGILGLDAVEEPVIEEPV